MNGKYYVDSPYIAYAISESESSVEKTIMTEIDATSHMFEKYGNPIIVCPHLERLTGNVTHGIVFGRLISDYETPAFEIIVELVTGKGFTTAGDSSTLVRKIFDRKQTEREIARLIRSLEDVRKSISEEVKPHEDSFDEQHIRDFIDLYIETQRDSQDAFNTSVFTAANMNRVTLVAIETTYNTLDWALLLMSEYPEIQANCQEKNESICGNRNVTYADRASLPFMKYNVTLAPPL